ncbi:uncharacterized protein LOC120190999 isoform X2 [Hibiscus syriacus]|uniref:uncharacterized protein LOC120190999 isoform X2 n=1 Tax=Hibiscus syriacus TaxID=106335 RepID=UPI0019235B2E|nr:uncharacterized protein LOC120190999 isoform X2 [Hibiscus syriacus]
MATRSRASKPRRQLGELLQEQQEPFVLEVYLSERGCVKKKLISGVNFNFSCCHGNSAKFLNKSGSQNDRKKGSPQFPKVLQVILRNKFFKIKGLRTKNSDDEDGKLSVAEIHINTQETAEADRFSSASSATVYNSCSDSDIDEPRMFTDTSISDHKLDDESEKMAAADSKLEWSCMEENKQHSPQSVLEEVYTSTSSPLDTRKVSSTKLFKVDSILSPWLLNLLQTRAEKSSCEGLKQHKMPSSSRPSRSKRVSQQTKQLPVDCIKELVENNRGKEQKGKGKGFKGSAEVIRRVRCENMKGWGKRLGDESIIKQLLESDIMNSTQWRNGFESRKWNIGMVVGSSIVEEIISEFVMDIMNVL